MKRWALALLLVSGAAAADPAVPEPPGFRMDAYRAPVPDAVPGGHVLDTAALKALIDTGRPVLIDVLASPRRPEGMRPGAPWLPQARRDIPGTVWLPEVGRGALNPALEARFQRRLHELTKGDLDTPVVFYCLPDCWMSWNAAKRAASYGYRDVFWYPEGSDGWQAAGLPLHQTQPEATE